MLQEPTKKGKKRTEGKGKQPATQRVLRTRFHQARYTFSDDEEGVKEEIQGYLCVSADPRRSGQTEGGENFIITAEELRQILKAQCKEEDQTVWMTTAQTGFPTTATEGELDNDLDRQLGKPTARCLHPAISAFIIQRQQELLTQDQAPAALLLFPLSMASAFVVPSNSAASLLSLRSARSLPATALFRTATQPLGTIAKRKSGARACRSAVDGYDSLLSLDSPTVWAAFILWSVPLPVAIGSILRLAESTSGQAERPALDVITKSTDKPLRVQRNLMWCFPSFGCFLKSADRQPPLGMPYWQKWGLFLNSWAGLAWYLNYKIKIEDELKEYNGEGLGGAGTQFPRFTSTNVQTLT